ncbi:hypothetical protein [Hydrogenibacillus schlegelii]|uniref:Uncharacterized protein n=1 Tax=Hydrogenibacillus schlegelii TaxID=1484 RepID=A0A132MIT6_HYDSH|nr:hypothetical protein TR75_09315 [Hydrogenibacillus schlegelii]OAR03718.1 hypothetical protein SA87_00595 [Hydrogenibacillus schlegelii]
MFAPSPWAPVFASVFADRVGRPFALSRGFCVRFPPQLRASSPTFASVFGLSEDGDEGSAGVRGTDAAASRRGWAPAEQAPAKGAPVGVGAGKSGAGGDG